ncbi:hypothetical protein [Lentibacter sp.]|uniref:hypothetical protein n=1 Tax=Lentibacter sp. TaxID=2024994 RepID=UPI003F6B65BC
MKRFLPAMAVAGLLSACSGDGTNPFDEPVDPEADPSTVNSKFVFDLEDKLTMNAVTYDADDNVLLINNLPFDGPGQRYEYRRTQGNVDIYRSIQTPTTGQVRSYAVFMKNDDAEVTAAVGERWIDFGYAGANVKRDAFNLPSGVGEYLYLGSYGAVRTRNDGASLEIVTGSAELYLDVLDFDNLPVGTEGETIEGAIVGNIRNRLRTDAAGNLIAQPLPDISLVLVQYDPETGQFDEGDVLTSFDGNIRDAGKWGGLISGGSGETIGAHLVMTGTAEMQNVRYEVIQWTDPATGDTGTEFGYNADADFNRILIDVNNGEAVPTQLADRSGIPAGATIVSTFDSITFESAADAREVGVILTEQQPTDLTPIP